MANRGNGTSLIVSVAVGALAGTAIGYVLGQMPIAIFAGAACGLIIGFFSAN